MTRLNIEGQHLLQSRAEGLYLHHPALLELDTKEQRKLAHQRHHRPMRCVTGERLEDERHPASLSTSHFQRLYPAVAKGKVGWLKEERHPHIK